MADLKLYMLLLGCRPPGRHVEQHDFFFGIAPSLKELIPEIRAFWREAAQKIHIDAWREVTAVDNYRITVKLKDDAYGYEPEQPPKLFFINLGGYQPGKFEEQHYTLLTVKPDKAAALREAKDTLFYKENGFDNAVSHIDDKYGIDVDDLYAIEEVLSARQKEQYKIVLTRQEVLTNDPIHLGYLKLSTLK